MAQAWERQFQMGILGLTSFVDHRSKAFLHQEHIHNCYLVIDGDNVAHHIFKHKPRFTGHGTDYSSYASEVESFFLDLKSCDITAVVLLDGAREAGGAKLPKQLSRLTEKVRRSVRVATAKHHHEDVFPPLARTVFVQVARRLAVPVAQCPREADGCAAAVARRLECAVLSDDSDLCALGVPVVRLTPWGRPCTAPRASRTAERFMNCVVFRPERLLQHYGISADHLPLLATLPGNDVVTPAALDPFFRRLYAAHSGGGGGGRRERPGQRIKATLRWLATQTSPRLALDKVLSMLPEKDRGAVEAHAALVTASIADESFEFLRSALPELHCTLLEHAPAAADPPPPPPGADCLPVPDAVLPVCVRDAAGDAPSLLEPGVEQLTEPAAALTAAPLLARLASLLAGEDRRVTLYVRGGREVVERAVAADWPAATPPLVPLDPAADTARREAQVLAVLGVRPDALAAAPPPLRLLAAALVAWRRATAGRSDRRAVRAALQACAGLVPDDALPLPAESTASWRERVAALRQRPAAARAPAAVHLHYELQYVLLVAVSANEALGRPVDALDVDRTVHGPLAISLGFGTLLEDDVGSSDTHQPDLLADADMERLISGLTDLVEAVVEDGCPPSLSPGVTPAAVLNVEPGAAERLAELVAAASVTRTIRSRKRPRQLSRSRSKKRSRR